MASNEAPLLPRRNRRRFRDVVLLVSSSLVMVYVLALVMSVSTRHVSDLESINIKEEEQRLAQVRAENRNLEAEAKHLSQLNSIRTASEVERLRRQQAMEAQAQQMRAIHLKQKLLLAEKKQEALRQQVAREKLQESMIKHDAQILLGANRVSKKQRHVSRVTEQLVGEYVKICNPWGCKISYKPESDDNMEWYAGKNKTSEWPGKGHTERVTGNHLLYPLGPATRENLTRIQVPEHDIIPKQSKLGDNWISFGHGDSFVKIDNSAIGSAASLPPWKKPPLYNFNNFNYTLKPLGLPDGVPDTDAAALADGARAPRRCPANPDGTQPRDCLTGGNGVDGVFESSPLSSSFYDPNRVLMEQHGVAVDTWPWADTREAHAWDGEAKDHPPPSTATAYDYDQSEAPLWAFNNHALRSQAGYADPDGPANKQLMLGRSAAAAAAATMRAHRWRP